jgi:hypothetical protein
VVVRLVVPFTVLGDQNNITLPEESGMLRVAVAWSDTASAVMPASYTLKWLDGHSGRVLAPGSHAELIVELPTSPAIRREHSVDISLRAASGELLVIKNVHQ